MPSTPLPTPLPTPLATPVSTPVAAAQASEAKKWDPTTYDQAWTQMAADGKDPHGEVAFLQRLAVRRSHDISPVLDAGCGTGRVAVELSARGYEVEATDIDSDMLGHAREKAPDITWHLANLAQLNLGREFNTVIAAGTVILFVDESDRPAAIAGICRHVQPGGLVVAGMQLQRADGRRVAIADWQGWFLDNGFVEVERYTTWDDKPWPNRATGTDDFTQADDTPDEFVVKPAQSAGSRDTGRLALIAATGLAFLTVAIPLQLEKQWITVGWAIQFSG